MIVKTWMNMSMHVRTREEQVTHSQAINCFRNTFYSSHPLLKKSYSEKVSLQGNSKLT